MTPKSIVIGLAALSLAIAAAVAQDVPVLTHPFYPLKVGNKWYYRAGKQKVVVTVDRLESLEFKKDDKVNKLAAHHLLITMGDREGGEYVSVQPDGFYRFAGDDKDSTASVRFFKLPLKKGETWECKVDLPGPAVQGTFVADEEDVKVGGKMYKTMTASCPDLQVGTQKMAVKYWFAADVGIVKQTVQIGGQSVTLELEKFEPGK